MTQSTSTTKKQRPDYDSPWKEIIEYFFIEFMAFFFPGIHADIDWSCAPEFLNKEFQQVTRAAETGRQLVDKLVKVWRKDGDEVWLLIHIEVQSSYESRFAQRMFVYNYRIFDQYKKNVISLAILTDDSTTWRPERYQHGGWGSEMRLLFPSVKLIDYEAQWAMLESNPNPFAVVVMAHLRTLSTQHKLTDRLRWKIYVVEGLYERGYKRQDVLELFRFIDWIMRLSEELEQSFQIRLSQLEEIQKMRYVTTIERNAEERGRSEGIEQGIEQGVEQGVEQATRDNIFEILSVRFPTVPEELTETINAVDELVLLKQILQQAVLAHTMEEFERLVDTAIDKNQE